jgi:RuvA, C-terminal domain
MSPQTSSPSGEPIIGPCIAASSASKPIIDPGGEAAIRFRHADGTPYGQPVTPHVVDVQTKVFSALRHLGFREREVRAVLAELSSDEQCEPTAAGLLREALRRIRPAPR